MLLRQKHDIIKVLNFVRLRDTRLWHGSDSNVVLKPCRTILKAEPPLQKKFKTYRCEKIWL